MAVRAFEWLDRRALAAIRFVDAVTGAPPEGLIALAAGGVSLRRKQSGEFIVLAAPGLEEHQSSFAAPPPTPPVGTVAIAVDAWPASSAYAARRFTLRLPRDPDPANRANPGSLFNAVVVELLPSPAYQAAGQGAALRVTVRRADDRRRIGGALVRLRPSGGLPPCRALTDAAGEALLVVRGVPLASPGPGATMLADIAATADVLVDPALAAFVADDALDAARAAAWARAGSSLIDPDDIEARFATPPPPAVAVRLAAGAVGVLTLDWTPPP